MRARLPRRALFLEWMWRLCRRPGAGESRLCLGGAAQARGSAGDSPRRVRQARRGALRDPGVGLRAIKKNAEPPERLRTFVRSRCEEDPKAFDVPMSARLPIAKASLLDREGRSRGTGQTDVTVLPPFTVHRPGPRRYAEAHRLDRLPRPPPALADQALRAETRCPLSAQLRRGNCTITPEGTPGEANSRTFRTVQVHSAPARRGCHLP